MNMEKFEVFIAFILFSTNEQIMDVSAPSFPSYAKGQTLFLQRENHALETEGVQPVIRMMNNIKFTRYEIVDIHHSIYELVANNAKFIRVSETELDTIGISTNFKMEVYVKEVK